MFSLLEYDISDQFTVTVEGRYAKDKKVVRGSVLTVADSANLQGLITNLTVASITGDRLVINDDTNIFTPRFTLTYRPNDDVTLYGLVAKGDKPLDFNLAFFDNDTDPTEIVNAVANGRAVIKEEVSWTYELGAKTTILDGRGLFNVSGFYIDWDNQAISSVEDILLSDGSIENNDTVRSVPGARLIGLEGLEVEATPPLGPNRQLPPDPRIRPCRPQI